MNLFLRPEEISPAGSGQPVSGSPVSKPDFDALYVHTLWLISKLPKAILMSHENEWYFATRQNINKIYNEL